jgi:hypothetical protein
MEKVREFPAAGSMFEAGTMTETMQIRRDALADRVISAVTAAFQKLAEHQDEIRQLWSEFEILKPGETIKGCRTKTEFAEVHLRRNIRAVQYMLKGGNKNRGETVSCIEVNTESRAGLARYPFKCEDRVLGALIDAQTRALVDEDYLTAAALEGTIIHHICGDMT